MSTESKTRTVVTVTFIGGPRNGQTQRCTAAGDGGSPISVGCVTEAHAKGMHGVYKRVIGTKNMQWHELPRRTVVKAPVKK